MPRINHTGRPWWYDEKTGSICSPAGYLASGLEYREKKSDTPFGDKGADIALLAFSPDLYHKLHDLVEISEAITRDLESISKLAERIERDTIKNNICFFANSARPNFNEAISNAEWLLERIEKEVREFEDG